MQVLTVYSVPVIFCLHFAFSWGNFGQQFLGRLKLNGRIPFFDFFFLLYQLIKQSWFPTLTVISSQLSISLRNPYTYTQWVERLACPTIVWVWSTFFFFFRGKFSWSILFSFFGHFILGSKPFWRRTGGSRLMRISLLPISLLRFFKTITKIWLMRFYGLFILLLRT